MFSYLATIHYKIKSKLKPSSDIEDNSVHDKILYLLLKLNLCL